MPGRLLAIYLLPWEVRLCRKVAWHIRETCFGSRDFGAQNIAKREGEMHSLDGIEHDWIRLETW